MAAQRIILKELKTEFGGAAEAAADPWSRLTVVLGNVKEEIGTALLPAFETLADWLSVTLPQAIDKTKQMLKDAKKWWDANKESVKTLATVLIDIFVPASEDTDDSIKDFTKSLGTLKDFLTDLTVFILEAVKVWLFLEKGVIKAYDAVGSFIIATGHAVNAVDRLSGGTGHAGDSMVAFGKDLKNTARKELEGVRQDARQAQDAIDDLHGKNVNDHRHDLAAVHQDVHGGRLVACPAGRRQDGPGRQDHQGHRAHRRRRAAVGQQGRGDGPGPVGGQTRVPGVGGSEGIPGFALGGKIAQTGQAHTGVGKIMDRWGTLIEAAGIKQAVEAIRWSVVGVLAPVRWQWQVGVAPAIRLPGASPPRLRLPQPVLHRRPGGHPSRHAAARRLTSAAHPGISC